MVEFQTELFKRDEVDVTNDNQLIKHYTLSAEEKKMANVEESQIELAINDY